MQQAGGDVFGFDLAFFFGETSNRAAHAVVQKEVADRLTIVGITRTDTQGNETTPISGEVYILIHELNVSHLRILRDVDGTIRCEQVIRQHHDHPR